MHVWKEKSVKCDGSCHIHSVQHSLSEVRHGSVKNCLWAPKPIAAKGTFVIKRNCRAHIQLPTVTLHDIALQDLIAIKHACHMYAQA